MIINTDIDIDVADREQILQNLTYVNASMEKDGKQMRHTSGVYFQNIPRDPFTNNATINYEEAEELGYVKIDMLNNSLYHGVRDEMHLVELMNKEPMWELLRHKEFVEQLHHLNRYHKLVSKYMPNTVEKIAMILAIIRPAKSHLQGKNWKDIEETVWEKEEEGYQFKKSHAFSYALSIIVQMNLIVERLHSAD